MRNQLAPIREHLPTLLRTALTVAECGAPARCVDGLEISIATVYRHIDTLEQLIGYRLFDRKRRRWQLLKGSEKAIDTARQIEHLLDRLESELLAETPRPGGVLNIALSEDFAAHYLTPRLAALQAILNGTQINLKVSPEFADLTNSSTDIAIRPHDAPGQSLIGRRAGRMHHALYAATSYIAEHGRPGSTKDFSTHIFCGFGHRLRQFTIAKWQEANVDPARVNVRFDSTVALERAVTAGVGIGILPCYVGDHLEGVVPILTVPKGLPVDLWVVTTVAKRERADIRSFLKYISSEIKSDKSLFEGDLYVSS